MPSSFGGSAIDALVFRTLNHLLAGESWARERLRPFSGAQVLIKAGWLELALRIDQRGLLVAADALQSADVTLTLPLDAPVRFLVDRPSLFAAVKLSGSADIAESLAFVMRNLHWDAEADMAKLLGDIPARRGMLIGRQSALQFEELFKRSAQNFAEYATEDSNLLASSLEVGKFSAAVDVLRDDAARLEKRIGLL